MLYLLDASALIRVHGDYYPVHRVPEFWNWLFRMAEERRVAVPVEVYEETVHRKKPDDFVRWIRRRRETMKLGETVRPDLVASVVDRGYAPDLKEDEIRRLGRDPFLVAYALRDPEDRCVVTHERSRPGRQRANRHIPDVCADLNIRCIHLFGLIRELDFRTGGQLLEVTRRLPLDGPPASN